MDQRTVADLLASKRRDTEKAHSEKLDKEYFSTYVPFWNFTDLDDRRNWWLLVGFRIFQALFMTKNMVHPDEYWQATQVAYNWVYGGVMLPWEWDDQFKLRNTIYPAYLAAPLYLLKQSGLDYPWLVRVQPYLTHCPLVILNDFFVWKIGKRVVGISGTRIAMLLLLTNRCQNEYIIRCFTNGLEQIFSVIAFWFFIDQGDRFSLNTVILTALITLAFMMRNTSPIGWIPLLADKVLRNSSLVPFILSGIFVAVPILALCTYIDTVYYGGYEWVFTGINFLKVNVVHGLSKYFGEDPWYWYLIAFAPLIYTAIYPVVLYANTIGHSQLQAQKKQVPYLTYYTCFYVFFFSLIPHKEARFLVPLIPFTLLTAGEVIASSLQRRAHLLSTMLWVYIIVESTILGFLTLFHQRAWEIEQYLLDTERPIHSFYRLDRFDTPYYSWLHPVPGQPSTKIYAANRNPKFALLAQGQSLPSAFEGELTLCTKLVSEIQSGLMLPEYITLQQFDCDDGFGCFQLCKHAIQNLSGENGKLYTIDHVFAGDVYVDTQQDGFTLRRKERLLYRLDTAIYTPF